MPISRREFLKLAGLAAGGLSLSSDANWALPQNVVPRRGNAQRITILGAGLAGLAAGWELKSAGHDVTILEAQLHPGRRVHTIREGLSEAGLTVYGGVNAPYIWLKTPSGLTSWDFFDKLLNECHVVGTPGSGFGPSGEGYFRLSAFGNRDNVIEAVARIMKNLR